MTPAITPVMDDVEHTEYCVVDSPGRAVVPLGSSTSQGMVAPENGVIWYRRRKPSFVTLESVVK